MRTLSTYYLPLLLLFLFSRKGDMHIQKIKLNPSPKAIISIVKYQNGLLYAARPLVKNSKWAMYYSEFGEQQTSFAKAKRIKIVDKLAGRRHFVPGAYRPETKELYFTTVSKVGKKNVHLAIAKGTLSDLKLTDIELLNFNDPNHHYAHPTLFSDGRRMILSSSMDGNMNLYQFSKDSLGQWQLDRRILELESGYDEILPNLLNDSTLVFSSNRDTGKGSFDLYITRAERPDFWGAPKNLAEFNGHNDEFSYFQLDSTHGYFTSADTIFGSTDFLYFDREE
ncbi:MAG TPA: hypothetical protein ENK85_04905 [Saprospiraceae bacterium]|nr:hypothetical protein [Saprospiraceae bacterium]